MLNAKRTIVEIHVLVYCMRIRLLFGFFLMILLCGSHSIARECGVAILLFARQLKQTANQLNSVVPQPQNEKQYADFTENTQLTDQQNQKNLTDESMDISAPQYFILTVSQQEKSNGDQL